MGVYARWILSPLRLPISPHQHGSILTPDRADVKLTTADFQLIIYTVRFMSLPDNSIGNEIRILYNDNDIAVCIKPRGYLSEASLNEPEKSLPRHLAYRLKLPEGSVYTVHRLDRETYGIMVFALNKKSAAKLSAAVQAGQFRKSYVALVHGTPEPASGTMSDLLFKDTAKGKVYVVTRLRRGVKQAELFYETLSMNEGISLVRIDLVTGRTHQIRVQFASRHWPLFGDRKYGAKDGYSSLALCASKLTFPHPSTGKTVEFSIDPYFDTSTRNESESE